MDKQPNPAPSTAPGEIGPAKAAHERAEAIYAATISHYEPCAWEDIGPVGMEFWSAVAAAATAEAERRIEYLEEMLASVREARDRMLERQERASQRRDEAERRVAELERERDAIGKAASEAMSACEQHAYDFVAKRDELERRLAASEAERADLIAEFGDFKEDEREARSRLFTERNDWKARADDAERRLAASEAREAKLRETLSKLPRACDWLAPNYCGCHDAVLAAVAATTEAS